LFLTGNQNTAPGKHLWQEQNQLNSSDCLTPTVLFSYKIQSMPPVTTYECQSSYLSHFSRPLVY